MSSMKNRVALVTGAAGGMGEVIARLFAERGAAVVVADVSEEAGAAVMQEIRKSGGDALFVRTDVSNEKDVRDLVARTVAHYGRLDFAINNAGIEGDVLPLAEQTAESFRRVLAVNLEGVFYGIKYQIPIMMDQGGGAIVNVSSISGVRGHPELGPYVAAKHGVNGLTKTAAIEYGPHGVRVNSLCPGGIRTAILERYLEASPQLRATIIDTNPLRRLAEPEEMAKSVIWLCSDDASYVNGHELVADGGKIVSDI